GFAVRSRPVPVAQREPASAIAPATAPAPAAPRAGGVRRPARAPAASPPAGSRRGGERRPRVTHAPAPSVRERPLRTPQPSPVALVADVERRAPSAPGRSGSWPLLPAALALLALVAAVGGAAVRMIIARGPFVEGATADAPTAEDPRRARVAVREWAAPHRPRGGLRGAGRRLRPLSPVAGQRRPHGERDGRARHAGDGGRRPERRIAA